MPIDFTTAPRYVRCWRCNTAVTPGESCRACHAGSLTTAPDVARADGNQQRCWECNKLLATAFAFRGRVETVCPRCKVLNVFTGSAADSALAHAIAEALESERVERLARQRERDHEARVARRPPPSPPVTTLTVDGFLGLMEERWQAFRKQRARDLAGVAVGLRFQVFMRDGFRCRYCGISVDDGAVLHADHVMPASKGGPTTLDNLVTACVECNLGKSNRILTT